jgi:hypothetical protein
VQKTLKMPFAVAVMVVQLLLVRQVEKQLVVQLEIQQEFAE